MSNKKSNIRFFEDLKVWNYSRKLQSKISEVVKTFPKYEQYRLVDQMVRLSRSVARNIAEGYGRYHFQENIQFCRQSRGSLCELWNDIITAYEEKYINENKYEELHSDYDDCHHLLNGYIAYLKKAKNDYKVSEDETIYALDTNNQ